MTGLCACGCGTPTTISPKSNTAKGWVAGQPRTWAKGHHVRLSGQDWIEDENGCHVWQLAKDKDGYGYKNLPSKRGCMAHRWFYEQVNGPIPEGLTIDHLCRNRPCVNPAHMEVVTLQENIARRDRAPEFQG